LKDPELLVRGTAASALGRIPSAASVAIPRLIDAMSKDETTRYHAAEALASFGPRSEPAVPVLLQALHDENRVVRGNAANALGRIGPAARLAVPQLRALLGDKYESVHEAARGALVALGEHEPSLLPPTETWPEQGFSPEAWQRTQNGGRYVFYKDLVRSRLVEELTAAEIVRRLGQPDFRERHLLTYILKYSSDEPGVRYDALWKMCVPLDREGRSQSPFLRAD